MTYSGMTALVTGASSGLGEAFAEQLAAAGANLVLAARSEDRLHELADRLRARYAARVIVRPIDLASAQALTTFAAEIERGDVMIDLLVNNAGFGIFEDVLAASLERQLAQIDVNIRALVTLARACAPAMVAAGRGGIINVASTAGFQPMPGAAVYAASKAFVVSFSQAFAYELREKNVRVTVVCPGPVATAFFANMNPRLSAEKMDQPATVVREALRAFAKGAATVIPGKIANRISAFGVRFMPPPLVLRVAANIARTMNQK